MHFSTNRHPKYSLLSFRFIAQVNAHLTPRMAARVIHNRTVNVHGDEGHNISVDLSLEFLSKDDLKRNGSISWHKVSGNNLSRYWMKCSMSLK